MIIVLNSALNSGGGEGRNMFQGQGMKLNS